MKQEIIYGILTGLFFGVLFRYTPPIQLPPLSSYFDNNLNLCTTLPPYLKTIWSPSGRSYTFVDVLARTCDWFVVSLPKNATMIWTTGHSDMPKDVLAKLRLGEGQIWNQLHDGWIFADKAKLHKLLVDANHTHYQPETYVLSDPKECVEFFNFVKKSPDSIWLTKVPTSAEGEGIIVNPDINVLREVWLEDPLTEGEYRCKESDREDVLIQRYLVNPLLLEGKKMEIRSYWVIASVEPLIVLFRDGTVRITTQEYKHGDWENPLIHITNTKQQKKADPHYYKTEQLRKWTVHQLAEYLSKEKKISGDPEVWLNNLREMLIERIGVMVLSVHSQLIKQKTKTGWDGRFELFGMDVILDENLHPWLTELQDGPSLSMDPGVKQQVVPNLIKDLMNVELEIDQTLRASKPLTKVKSLGGWIQIDLEKYRGLLPTDLQK